MQFNHCAQSYANYCTLYTGIRPAKRLPWDRKRAVKPRETSDKQINDIFAYLITSPPFFPSFAACSIPCAPSRVRDASSKRFVCIFISFN